MRYLFFVVLILGALTTAGQTTAEQYLDKATERYITDKNIEATIILIDQAIKLKPDYAEAHDYRGIILRTKGDLAGAEADFSKAIQLSPKMAMYYEHRAAIREKRNNIAGATADYNSAVEVEPKRTEALFERSNFRIRIKDYVGALADCNKSLSIDPEYWGVLKARAAAYRALGKITLAEADEKTYAEEMKKMLQGIQ